MLFLFVPLPFFVDIADMRFVSVESVATGEKLSIPFPLGGFAFFGILLLGFFLSFFSKNLTSRLMSNSNLIFLYGIVLPLLCLYAYFISALPFVRILQVFFPLLVLGLLALPSDERQLKSILFIILTSVYLLVCAHFFSLLLYARDLTSLDERHEFPFVFGFFVYQSATYYPAVLVLYTYLTFIYILFIKRSFLLIAMILVTSFIAFSAGRKATLVEFLLIYILLFFFYMYSFIKNSFKASSFWRAGFGIFSYTSILVFITYFYSTAHVRLEDSVDDLSSGRIEIYLRAFEFLSSDWKSFLFGFGVDGAPSLHNYFLDQIARLGLVGVLVLVLVVFAAYTACFSLRKVKLSPKSKIILIIVFVPALVQSFVNASFSQPFYFLNFLVVFLLMYSYLSKRLKV